PDVPGVAVGFNLSEGTKWGGSWEILTPIGAQPQNPGVSPRDEQALREGEDVRKGAEEQPGTAYGYPPLRGRRRGGFSIEVLFIRSANAVWTCRCGNRLHSRPGQQNLPAVCLRPCGQ